MDTTLDRSLVIKLVESYLGQPHKLFEHLLKSGNNAITSLIELLETTPLIFDENNVDEESGFIYRHYLKFKSVFIEHPLNTDKTGKLYPAEAKLANLNYYVIVKGDIVQYRDKYSIYGKKIVETTKIAESLGETLLHFPNMVGCSSCATIGESNEKTKQCFADFGGYYITKGTDRIIIIEEKIRDNKPQILTLFGIEQAIIYSNPRDETAIVQKIMFQKINNTIQLFVSFFHPVSIFAVLYAMGIGNDYNLIHMIVGDEHDTELIDYVVKLLKAFKEKTAIFNKDDAIKYLLPFSKIHIRHPPTDPELLEIKKIEQLQMMFSKSILPHLNSSREYDNVVHDIKIPYICHVLKKLFTYNIKRTESSDRDCFTNKRLRLPSDFLLLEVNSLLKKLTHSTNKRFKQQFKNNTQNIPNITNDIDYISLSKSLVKNLTKISKSGPNTIILPKNTLSQFYSFLRRVDATVTDSSGNKIITPRYYHPSQVGFFCPTETPEGENVGISKQLALGSTISNGNLKDENDVIDATKLHTSFIHIKDSSLTELRNYCKIIINGLWIGYTTETMLIVKHLKNLKITHMIHNHTSISYNPEVNEIIIYTHSGRTIRPIFRVENNTLIITNDIIRKCLESDMNAFSFLEMYHSNCIEYIDTDEQFHGMIAENYEQVIEHKRRSEIIYDPSDFKEILNRYDETCYVNYDYCEINPILNLGTLSSTANYTNKNILTRVMFRFSLGKQSIGIANTSKSNALELTFILHNGNKSIVGSTVKQFTNNDTLSDGENCICMIMCYNGYNVDDGIIFNKTSIENGLFNADEMRKFSRTLEKNQTTTEDTVFGIPDKELLIHNTSTNFEHLQENGMIKKGTKVEKGDALIGQYAIVGTKNNSMKNVKNMSEVYDKAITGYVDETHIMKDIKGMTMMGVSIRVPRRPVVGDKFASQCAQKGICGIMIPGYEMPVTEDGTIPDIIINCHNFPKRRTLSQLQELLAGKCAALLGQRVDGTAFKPSTIHEFEDILKTYNKHPSGSEPTYNGYTGEKYRTAITTGISYYHRLKHLVEDRVNSRAEGRMEFLTRAAPSGKAKGGGSKIGTMESNGIAAHGSSFTLKERMVNLCDAYSMRVCANIVLNEITGVSNQCGTVAVRVVDDSNNMSSRPKVSDSYVCMNCRNGNNIVQIAIPYSLHLLNMEVQCINVGMKFMTE